MLSLSAFSSSPNAESALRESVERFRALDSYVVEFYRTDENPSSRTVIHRRISFKRPSHYRVEDLSPQQVTDLKGEQPSTSECRGWTEVFEGENRWTLQPELKRFALTKVGPNEGSPATALFMSVPPRLYTFEYGPNEVLSSGGKNYKCIVVHAHSPDGKSITTWIDNESGLPIRSAATLAQWHFEVKLENPVFNPALPDDLFNFDPDPTWSKLDRISSPCSR